MPTISPSSRRPATPSTPLLRILHLRLIAALHRINCFGDLLLRLRLKLAEIATEQDFEFRGQFIAFSRHLAAIALITFIATSFTATPFCAQPSLPMFAMSIPGMVMSIGFGHARDTGHVLWTSAPSS